MSAELATRAFNVALSGSAAQRTLIAWLFFYLAGGHVTLPVLTCTFMFSRAKRHPVLINMCLTWIITSIIACILFYAGQYGSDGPDRGLCMGQAALMQFAVPPMISVSSFAIIYHVWTTVRTSLQKELPRSLNWMRTFRTTLLLVMPYIAFATFGITGAILAANNPHEVSLTRRKLYCSVNHSPLSVIVAMFTAVVLLTTIYYEVRICIVLRRNWIGLRNSGQEDNTGVDPHLIVRVAVFGVYVIVGFILSLVSVFVSTAAPDMFIATVPLVITFVFGIQADIQGEWAFWRRWQTPRRPPSDGPRMKIDDV